MSTNFSIVPVERIQNSILLIRGQKVMLDSDLARIYGVTTTRLNEQVKRNRERFPHDFMFQLTAGEKADWAHYGRSPRDFSERNDGIVCKTLSALTPHWPRPKLNLR